MSMKENFLREVKIGDTVELMVGTKEMTGTVIALDLDTVRIKRENGKKPVLALDSISYYEVGEYLAKEDGNEDVSDNAKDTTEGISTVIDEEKPEETNTTTMPDPNQPVEQSAEVLNEANSVQQVLNQIAALRR